MLESFVQKIGVKTSFPLPFHASLQIRESFDSNRGISRFNLSRGLYEALHLDGIITVVRWFTRMVDYNCGGSRFVYTMLTMIRTLAKVRDAGQIWTPSCYNRRRVIDSVEPRRVIAKSVAFCLLYRDLHLNLIRLPSRWEGIRRDNELFKSRVSPFAPEISKKKGKKRKKRIEEEKKETQRKSASSCAHEHALCSVHFSISAVSCLIVSR